MIDLSTMVGRVISPTNRTVARLRDGLIRAAAILPALRRYVLEMRFKPMPRYDQGAVVHNSNPPAPASAVGTLFIQPTVDTRTATGVRLDDILGSGFAVLCWNNNPRSIPGPQEFARWRAAGAVFIELVAEHPIALERRRCGHRRRRHHRRRPDRGGQGVRLASRPVLFLRPDRHRRLHRATGAGTVRTAGQHPDFVDGAEGGDRNAAPTRPVRHVAQPAAEPAGPVG